MMSLSMKIFAAAVKYSLKRSRARRVAVAAAAVTRRALELLAG